MYSKQGIIFKAIIGSCYPDKCLTFQKILKMPNAVASNSTSFRNFAQKSKNMKRLHFRNEKAFLEKLDGKVYAICDKNGHYLCDVIEEDYLRLVDAGVLINLDDNLDYTLMEADCNYMITLDLSKKGCEDFKERFGLFIDIDNERQIILFNCSSINYEIDSLVLKSSTDESETSFVFMDGIAVQIESLKSHVPISRPIILTYPHKKDAFNSIRMRDEIKDYRGHSWDGDYYSIALLYGKERILK